MAYLAIAYLHTLNCSYPYNSSNILPPANRRTHDVELYSIGVSFVISHSEVLLPRLHFFIAPHYCPAIVMS